MEDASRYPLSLFHLEVSFILYRDRNNKTIMSMEKEERIVIEVNNLVKRYGDHTAVDHLSFKIE